MRAATQVTYDRLSWWYDLLTGGNEDQARASGLSMLGMQPGESVLEIGCGTGRSLVDLLPTVGPSGHAWGVDISMGMCRIARNRIAAPGAAGNGGVLAGDALELPFRSGCLDAVLMCFALELFETSEIPLVLGEVRRVLRPTGRLSVVSMAHADPRGLAVRLYEWAHAQFPAAIDCRPIPVTEALQDAGWVVRRIERLSIWGLPVEAALAEKCLAKQAFADILCRSSKNGVPFARME